MKLAAVELTMVELAVMDLVVKPAVTILAEKFVEV
jgi:hypothetical protein